MRSRTIDVRALARVEGEGGLHVKVTNGAVSEVELRIFEPPRFFEAFLRGRSYEEVPDITARICGICPVAYQLASMQAIETAFGARPGDELQALRRLALCGEWIESHALHIYLLHAPDFLGYPDAIQMAKDHGDTVRRGLRLKKLGSEIVRVVGGRPIHPINLRVGGFHHPPSRADLAPLARELAWARQAAIDTVRWVSTFGFPDFERDYVFVATRGDNGYPMTGGRIVSNRGLDIDVADYDAHFEEAHVARSTALHAVMTGTGEYLVGPLARYNLNFDHLAPDAREAAHNAGLTAVCNNPFQSIIIRSVELVQACNEALAIVDGYERPARASLAVTPRRGSAWAGVEAPRGLLVHRYAFDEAGRVLEARIVPPTSQNQKTIEGDLRAFVGRNLGLPDDQLTWQCEQAVRNHDPCISCATHFLTVVVEHR